MKRCTCGWRESPDVAALVARERAREALVEAARDMNTNPESYTYRAALCNALRALDAAEKQ